MTDGSFGDYDFIVGRKYISRCGIYLHFSYMTIRWDGVVVPMKEWHNAKPEGCHAIPPDGLVTKVHVNSIP
jgi:hypothetical protein